MKRLISTNGRAETIISQDKPDNISAFFNDAVTDTIMPVYSNYLKTECLFLLDYSTDGAKNWKGNRLIILTGDREIDFIKRQTLGRGINWLGTGHHIKDNSVIIKALSYFYNEKIDTDSINDHVKNEMDKVNKILKNPKENNYDLCKLTKQILQNWTELWDCDEAYGLLQTTILLTNNELDDLEPVLIIRLVQAFEYQFVKETMKEELL